MHRLLPLVLLFCACTAVAQPCMPATQVPEHAEIAWSWSGDDRDVALSGNSLIVQTGASLLALDISTGKLRWEASIESQSSIFGRYPMVVTDDRIFLSLDKDLLVFAANDGHVVARTPMPRRVRLLAGPPVIAAADNTPSLASTLYSIDDLGVIRDSRITRSVESLQIAGDVVLAQMTPNVDEDRSSKVLAGFRLRDLAPMWSFVAEDTDLQQIDGRWYVGRFAWSSRRAIDVATGRLGTFLPPKPPTDDIWGGATWETEIVSSSKEDQPDCDRLRVNNPATGKARLMVDLPFGVTNTLRDGDHFYVFGSSSTYEHFIAQLDRNSGRLEKLWDQVPILVDWWFVRDKLLIGAGGKDGVVAIRLGRPRQ